MVVQIIKIIDPTSPFLSEYKKFIQKNITSLIKKVKDEFKNNSTKYTFNPKIIKENEIKDIDFKINESLSQKFDSDITSEFNKGDLIYQQMCIFVNKIQDIISKNRYLNRILKGNKIIFFLKGGMSARLVLLNTIQKMSISSEMKNKLIGMVYDCFKSGGDNDVGFKISHSNNLSPSEYDLIKRYCLKLILIEMKKFVLNVPSIIEDHYRSFLGKTIDIDGSLWRIESGKKFSKTIFKIGTNRHESFYWQRELPHSSHFYTTSNELMLNRTDVNHFGLCRIKATFKLILLKPSKDFLNMYNSNQIRVMKKDGIKCAAEMLDIATELQTFNGYHICDSRATQKPDFEIHSIENITNPPDYDVNMTSPDFEDNELNRLVAKYRNVLERISSG